MVIVCLDTDASVHLSQVCADLAMGQSLGRQRDHQAIPARQLSLPLLTSWTRRCDCHSVMPRPASADSVLPGLPLQGCRHHTRLPVAEVFIELAIERRLDHHLRQLLQESPSPVSPQPSGTGTCGQLPHQLVADDIQPRLRRIQVDGRLLTVHHIGHRSPSS
jgi:hypothetical protein